MSRRKAAGPDRTPILLPIDLPERPMAMAPPLGAALRGAGDLGADEFEENDDDFIHDPSPEPDPRPN